MGMEEGGVFELSAVYLPGTAEEVATYKDVAVLPNLPGRLALKIVIAKPIRITILAPTKKKKAS